MIENGARQYGLGGKGESAKPIRELVQRNKWAIPHFETWLDLKQA